ncbi:hypothetical protein [Pseudomonas sp. W2-17]|uniref:hypothetical protein n=1 Tax=Pseudomonas sp. W2-17 TaxID=3058039 RepID=UPI0034E07824
MTHLDITPLGMFHADLDGSRPDGMWLSVRIETAQGCAKDPAEGWHGGFTEKKWSTKLSAFIAHSTLAVIESHPFVHTTLDQADYDNDQ